MFKLYIVFVATLFTHSNLFAQKKGFKDDVYGSSHGKSVVDEADTRLPMVDGLVQYEYIFECDLSKDQLYLNSKTWMANMFKSAKEVIQLDDPVNGRIIGKGSFDYNPKKGMIGMPSVVHFSIQIDVRDNKYRCRLYDFVDERNDINELNDIADGNRRKMTNTRRFAQVQINEINSVLTALIGDFERDVCVDDSF